MEEEMTAVILAAGIGSRLGAPVPKGLMKLPNGESILARQVRILTEAGIANITMVVGYEREMIQQEIHGVSFVYNPRFSETNTAKSLLCACKHIDDDVIWLNGDVVFDGEVIPQIIRQEDNTILVDSAVCGDEEVKYFADDSGSILEISKEVRNGHGEALGINLVKKEFLPDFAQALTDCKDNDYFEKAVQMLIDRGITFKKLELPDAKCIEVDFKQDWSKALDMFGGDN